MSLARSTENAGDIVWRAGDSAPFAVHPRWWSAVCNDLLPGAVHPSTVTLDGNPALLLPQHAAGAALSIALPMHDHLSLNDISVASSLPVDAVGQALDALLQDSAATQRGWLPAPVAWRGSRIADDSPLLDALRAAEQPAEAARWHAREVAATAWFELDDGALPVPGKLRRNLNRLQRALSAEGRVAFEVHDGQDPQALRRAFEDFLRLEASGWKGASGRRSTAIAHDPRLRAFYANLLGARDDTLCPQIALLRLDEHAIAAQYTLRTGTTHSVLKIAYDERYAHCSPGSQLLHEMMAHAQNSGVARLSLVTCPAWAARWHPRQAPVWHVTRYADSAGGRAMAHWDRSRHGARALLARQRSRLRAALPAASPSASTP